MVAVTIALPVYNGADYLDQALASLSGQSFADMQIVISDNASTDATPDIIAAWKARDSRIVSHRQSENIGGPANFDWVMNYGDSPWLMFASHDDWWSPNYVEELYKMVTAYPGTQLAAEQLILIRPDGSEDPRPFYEPINTAKGLRKKLLYLQHMNSEWYYGLFDRQALLAAKKTIKDFKHVWGSSGLLLLPFILAGTIVGSNAAIYYKRETPISAIRYKPKTVTEQFDLYTSFLKFSWRILQATPLPLFERLVLTAMLIPHANRRAWKLRRLLRNAILNCLHIKKT